MLSSSKTGFKAGAALALLAGVVALAAPAHAQVNGFNFFKVGYYTQTGPTTQVLQNYNFDSTVFEADPADATTATLSPGAGGQVTYDYNPVPQPIYYDQFNYNSNGFASQADLDAAFPQGTYTVNYGGGTETPGSFAVDYNMDTYATTNPLFDAATFNGLQGLQASHPFTLTWNVNTPGAGANDPLNFLDIYDTSGKVVFSDDFQGPNVTSVTLPANTLLPNTSYFANVIFSDRVDDFNGNTAADITDSNGTTFGPVQAFELQDTVAFKTAVPEPSSFALLGLGVLPLGLLAAKRRRAA